MYNTQCNNFRIEILKRLKCYDKFKSVTTLCKYNNIVNMVQTNRKQTL